MLRSLLGIACFFLLSLWLSAQPPQAPRPPQAPLGVCTCTGKSDCTCDPAACFCRACSGRKGVQISRTVAAPAPVVTQTALQIGTATQNVVQSALQIPTYTATFTLPVPVEAKTYEPGPLARRVGVPDLKATPDQPIPPGTYHAVLTPTQAPTARKPSGQAPSATKYSNVPPCKCGCMETGSCRCKNCAERTADSTWQAMLQAPLPSGPLSYEFALGIAQQGSLPIVVFVGTPTLSIPGAITCQEATFPSVTAPAVVVGVPGPGYMQWAATLPGEQTAAAIKAAVAKALFPPAPAQAQAPTFQPAGVTFGCADGSCGVSSFGGGCANGQCGAPSRGLFRRR